MVFFDTKKERAALVVLLLAVGLAIALSPYVSGLLGAPVLYVLFRPMHQWLSTKAIWHCSIGEMKLQHSRF